MTANIYNSDGNIKVTSQTGTNRYKCTMEKNGMVNEIF